MAAKDVAVELFLERERAEAFIADVEQDEPETAALLRVEAIEPHGRCYLADADFSGASSTPARGGLCTFRHGLGRRNQDQKPLRTGW